MNCTCRASVRHRPDCPEYRTHYYCLHCSRAGDHRTDDCPMWVKVTDEERTILAHFRGDCHDGDACPTCKSEQGYLRLNEEKDSRLAAQASIITSLQQQIDSEDEAGPFVDGMRLISTERLVVAHMRGNHGGEVVDSCAMCFLVAERNEAERKAEMHQVQITRQAETIRNFRTVARDAMARLNSIIEG